MDVPVDPETFSMSGIVETMNRALKDSGGTVQLKKRGRAGGNTRPVTQEEIRRMDTSIKLDAVSKDMKGMSSAEKLAWGVAKRKRGNELYRQGKLTEAADVYLQAMLSIDTTGTEEERLRSRREVQVPCCYNLAAVKLMQRDYNSAERLCSEVLKLDRHHCGAYVRRAKVHRKRERLAQARQDLRLARACAVHDDDERMVGAEEKALKRAVVAARAVTQARRKRDEAALRKLQASTGLYSDKPKARRRRRTGSSSSSATESDADDGSVGEGSGSGAGETGLGLAASTGVRARTRAAGSGAQPRVQGGSGAQRRARGGGLAAGDTDGRGQLEGEADAEKSCCSRLLSWFRYRL